MMIRNLLLNPTPRASFITSTGINTKIVDTDTGGVTISTINGYTGGGENHLIPLVMQEGVKAHFHAEIEVGQNLTHPDIMIYSKSFSVSGGYGGGVIDIDFTAKIDTAVNLKCGLSKGDNTTYRHLGIYTSADWQALQSLGLTYFDGSLMPLAS